MALAHIFIETKISLCLSTVFVDCAALKGGGGKVTQMAEVLQNSMGALKTFIRKVQYIWGTRFAPRRDTVSITIKTAKHLSWF